VTDTDCPLSPFTIYHAMSPTGPTAHMASTIKSNPAKLAFPLDRTHLFYGPS
jgi:hypothetical protein